MLVQVDHVLDIVAHAVLTVLEPRDLMNLTLLALKMKAHNRFATVVVQEDGDIHLAVAVMDAVEVDLFGEDSADDVEAVDFPSVVTMPSSGFESSAACCGASFATASAGAVTTVFVFSRRAEFRRSLT